MFDRLGKKLGFNTPARKSLAIYIKILPIFVLMGCIQGGWLAGLIVAVISLPISIGFMYIMSLMDPGA